MITVPWPIINGPPVGVTEGLPRRTGSVSAEVGTPGPVRPASQSKRQAPGVSPGLAADFRPLSL